MLIIQNRIMELAAKMPWLGVAHDFQALRPEDVLGLLTFLERRAELV